MPNILHLIRIGLVLSAIASAAPTLKNASLTAQFNDRGLRSIVNGQTLHFNKDDFSLVIDGAAITGSKLPAPTVESNPGVVTYRFQSPDFRISVLYELKPTWSFISKQILIEPVHSTSYRVDSVTLFDAGLDNSVISDYVPGSYLPQFAKPPSTSTKDYGIFLRFNNRLGALMTVQNPFLSVNRQANSVSLFYKPELAWNPANGPFSSDRGLLSLFALSGRTIPSRMTPEWKLPAGDAASKTPGADTAEVAAFTECVRAFLIHPPTHPSRVEVGWTLNDYQIDVATPVGRAEYKRIIDATSQLNIDRLLYGPANSSLARRDDSADDWKWEYVTWLGLGQKIRKGEWDVHSAALPASVREMLDYAQAKKVGILAYVYPSLPYAGDPSWLSGHAATLSSRAFQDHFIDLLVTFAKRTGIQGYSFDYAFLEYPGSSAYAQWWGWRRVLESLRTALPGIIIDGRQSYQLYGPWSWLAGSYPHPTGNDEQPESFTPFPDLHFDRVSADRQRYVAYWYRNYMFTPSEILPGYMTHQTERSRNGDLELSAFRQRDWDYLGWRYSVLSSIATAGWNNVVDMIPARDLAEFSSFSAADKTWFRNWLDFTERNRELLRHTVSILGPPAIGKPDGTAAIAADHGYLFLFNPNYEQLSATFSLDAAIGLTKPGKYILREVEPVKSRFSGPYKYGDSVSIPLRGTTAAVFEVTPAPAGSNPIAKAKPAESFGKAQQVVLSPAGHGTFTVPGRILRQLESRKKAWPIPWTDEDKGTAWLRPERLLLFVQIAEPDDRMQLALKIDGKPVTLEKAYSSVREHAPSFVGWYADLSAIEPDRPHSVELDYPKNLKPGQFRGLFFDNIEEE